MEKTLTRTVQDCILVESKYIDALASLGVEYIGKPCSRNTVYLALRYVINSDLAVAIRAEALRLGGKKTRKEIVRLA